MKEIGELLKLLNKSIVTVLNCINISVNFCITIFVSFLNFCLNNSVDGIVYECISM